MPALLSVAAMTVAVAPVVHADAWDKKTIATFSQSIEIPGKVLAPGTYVFKLMDSPSNRHIVRITNEREDQVIATVLAIPNYRLEPKSKTVFTFYEMPGGQPEVLREWFYPGDNFGQEFAYSKQRYTEILAAIRGRSTTTEVQTAAVVATPVVTAEATETRSVEAVETAPAPTADTSAPLTAPQVEEPEKLESPAEPIESVEPQAPAPAPEPVPEPQSDNDKTMPKTASQLMLIGLLGAAAAFTAFGVRSYRNKARY
jgi:hypothetical protein